MKRISIPNIGFILLSIILVQSSCKKSGGYNNPTNPSTNPSTVKEISLQSNATFGNYLVDKDGRSLYFFSVDADGKDHCTGGCEVVWPAFNTANLGADNLGAGLDASDFGHTTSASGTSQLTYKGWPLYYYAPATNGANTPEKPGQTLGDGVSGLWFIAKPDYSIMIAFEQLTGHDGKNYKSDYTEGDEATTYFTDGKWVTLYTFTKDSANNNNFTKADFSNNNIWPIYETDQVIVPSILDKSQFGSITVFGRKQLTYKSWPLYYFGLDAGTRGSNKGISFPTPGIWHVPVKDISAAP